MRAVASVRARKMNAEESDCRKMVTRRTNCGHYSNGSRSLSVLTLNVECRCSIMLQAPGSCFSLEKVLEDSNRVGSYSLCIQGLINVTSRNTMGRW